ncbi:glycoside hydrolase family 5 protein [Silvibacterium dinghuense]|nr:cellulase family glycosylhydrolase [Silvibacterium dinghuense]GGG94142.1 glycosyl hydrolase [Silvibacterium dinghuense]
MHAQTQADSAATAFRRAQELKSGINLSNWFASGDLSPQHLTTAVSEADLAAIHAMGFDSVRIGVDPSLIERHGDLQPANPAALATLHKAVDEALAAHLAVTLCIFPSDDYKHQLSSEWGVGELTETWRILAASFAQTDADHVFYELINEPEVQDPYRWMGIEARLVEAVRSVDAQHTMIAAGASYSGLGDLLATEPVHDANVIYTFHFYEPYPFTHQGATWGSAEWPFYRSIPYPATPQQITEQMKAVPSDLARYYLYLYAAGGWNAETIAGRIAFAAAWGKECGVPVIANEFGVYRDTADAASRMRWLHDVRTAFESNGIGWTMWDYAGNFGVARRSGGKIEPDAAVLEALGLK